MVGVVKVVRTTIILNSPVAVEAMVVILSPAPVVVTVPGRSTVVTVIVVETPSHGMVR